MNAPHFDVTTTSSSGNGSACAPMTESPTEIAVALAQRGGLQDSREMFRHYDSRSRMGVDDRLARRRFLLYVPDPPRKL